MRRAFAVAAVCGWAFGCTPGDLVEKSLIDALHPPMVLVEGRKLGLPTTGPGNRFVNGWLFENEARGLTITPERDAARVEVVRLRAGARTLSLATRGDASGLEVAATVGSRRLGVVTSSSAIDISLPADLALGRNRVDLEFGDRARIRLAGATVSAAAPAGGIEFDGGDIVHRPWSAADFLRWVEAGTTLIGEFVPPTKASPGQVFSLLLDRGDGSLETVLEVLPPTGSAGTPVPIRVVLRTTPGLVRIRLSASHEGPAGRWRGLRLQHRGTPPRAPEPRPAPRPKVVVLYVFDALRADVVGHLGSNSGATPCLDRLAAEGAVFANHFSVAPNTGPATTSLFTGYGFLRGRAIPDNGPGTLAEDFSDAGYRSVSISSNPHLARSFGLTRGFQDVIFEAIDEEFEAGVDAAPTVNDSADRVHEAALRWLEGLGGDDHAFLYLHTLNPHNPYTPPEPFPSRFLRSEGSSIDGGTKTLAAVRDLEKDVSPADERRIREWYTAGVAYNDAALCGLVDELKLRYGDELLLVVTSDHGEELFDHGGVLHGFTLYDEVLQVPLVMWWPQHIRPTLTGLATNTLDLTACLRAVAGSRCSEGAASGGRLWAAITDDVEDEGPPELHFATAPGLRRAAMVRSDRWKLVLSPRPRFGWGMGRGRGRTHDAEYLFDIFGDPAETTNLAGAAHLEVDWMRSRLAGWVAFWDARQPATDEVPLDGETRRRLEALGYAD